MPRTRSSSKSAESADPTDAVVNPSDIIAQESRESDQSLQSAKRSREDDQEPSDSDGDEDPTPENFGNDQVDQTDPEHRGRSREVRTSEPRQSSRLISRKVKRRATVPPNGPYEAKWPMHESMHEGPVPTLQLQWIPSSRPTNLNDPIHLTRPLNPRANDQDEAIRRRDPELLY
jgi:hypothetical protein